MTKQDIDQSYTSWLIYSDYLEENNQLALAEQIRFELDYKPVAYPPPYANYGLDVVGGYGWDYVGGYDHGASVGVIGDIGGGANDFIDVGGHYD